MSSKKIPMSSSLMALPPVGAVMAFCAMTGIEAVSSVTAIVMILFIVVDYCN
jgi:hypothetical protein